MTTQLHGDSRFDVFAYCVVCGGVCACVKSRSTRPRSSQDGLLICCHVRQSWYRIWMDSVMVGALRFHQRVSGFTSQREMTVMDSLYRTLWKRGSNRPTRQMLDLSKVPNVLLDLFDGITIRKDPCRRVASEAARVASHRRADESKTPCL